MEDVDYESLCNFVDTEVSGICNEQSAAEFWRQLDEDLAMYDKNWQPS